MNLVAYWTYLKETENYYGLEVKDSGRGYFYIENIHRVTMFKNKICRIASKNNNIRYEQHVIHTIIFPTEQEASLGLKNLYDYLVKRDYY